MNGSTQKESGLLNMLNKPPEMNEWGNEMTIKQIDNKYAINAANDTRGIDLLKTVLDYLDEGEEMKYRNTDERFGDTEVTFEIDEALVGMKPTFKQWAIEKADELECSVEEAYADLVADFLRQIEPA